MRKIIFSRKGIDSQYGGGNSPIMPDGKLISIPIPQDNREDGIPYQNVRAIGELSFKELIDQLKKNNRGENCHLDPDLRESVISREKGWRPIFGQKSGAVTHLIESNNVAVGDIFIFYGNFREVVKNNESGKYEYTMQHPRHIIFGYLVIDSIWDIGNKPFPEYKFDKKKLPGWAKSHAHFKFTQDAHNCLFVAREDFKKGIPGAGTFIYNDILALTKLGYNRSLWELDELFAPDKVKISCHENPDRFTQDKSNKKVQLHTVGIGQEFVVTPKTTKAEADLMRWVDNLICNSERFE
ncbi:MAG: hypothetical protein KKD31_06260 [Bacteroidetes bacterium]|nr:hypothetical protein [Bacteroidota bacterium]